MAGTADTPFTCIGLDDHKGSISVGVLEPGAEQPTHDKIFRGEAQCRRRVGRFDPTTLKVRFQARPTGYTGWPSWLPRWAATVGWLPRR